jgi:2-isopropylmalate synthase
VRFARNLCADIEFSPEDGYRSDPDFLCRVLEAVIAEGATTINIPDTVGYAVPELYGEFIRDLRQRIPNSDKAVWSVHCHNDLGMAVANSLAGVKIGGARQVECTINGLGERAGNSLEEVVMAVQDAARLLQLDLGIDTTQIVPASRMVSQTTGFVVQPNKAVVGANAFAHASGIHQDGVLKARDTYEIMRAEDVGWAANKIVLGKLGPQRVQAAAAGTGHPAGARRPRSTPPSRASRTWPTARARSSTRTSWPWSATRASPPNPSITACWRCPSSPKPANGRMRVWPSPPATRNIHAESDGNGPVDASLKAIESKVQSGAEMVLYSVNAITSGSTESQGEVTVRLQLGAGGQRRGG